MVSSVPPQCFTATHSYLKIAFDMTEDLHNAGGSSRSQAQVLGHAIETIRASERALSASDQNSEIAVRLAVVRIELQRVSNGKSLRLPYLMRALHSERARREDCIGPEVRHA